MSGPSPCGRRLKFLVGKLPDESELDPVPARGRGECGAGPDAERWLAASAPSWSTAELSLADIALVGLHPLNGGPRVASICRASRP